MAQSSPFFSTPIVFRAVYPKSTKASSKILKLTSANNWAATFEKLPVSATLGGKNYEYTIKEVGVNKIMGTYAKFYPMKY